MDKQTLDALNEIAIFKYGKRFYSICNDKQRVVLTLYNSGFLEELNGR